MPHHVPPPPRSTAAPPPPAAAALPCRKEEDGTEQSITTSLQLPSDERHGTGLTRTLRAGGQVRCVHMKISNEQPCMLPSRVC